MPHRDKQIKLIYMIFQTLVLFANIVQIYHFGSLMGLQIYITNSISIFFSIINNECDSILQYEKRNKHLTHWKHTAGPEIEPGIPATLVSSSTSELPGPILSLQIYTPCRHLELSGFFKFNALCQCYLPYFLWWTVYIANFQ